MNNQESTNTGSISQGVWGLINPFSTFQYEYLSPWALLPWSPLVGAMKTGGARFTPIYTLGIGEGLTKNMATTNILKKGVKKVFGGIEFGPVPRGTRGMAEHLIKAGNSGILSSELYAKKVGSAEILIKQYVKKTKYNELSGEALTKILNMGGAGFDEEVVKGITSGLRGIKSVMGISNALFYGLLAYEAGKFVASSAVKLFKGSVSALEYARSKNEHLRNLEFGQPLGAGYMSQGAATERQRALSEIARQHIDGSSFSGNEASYYSQRI